MRRCCPPTAAVPASPGRLAAPQPSLGPRVTRAPTSTCQRRSTTPSDPITLGYKTPAEVFKPGSGAIARATNRETVVTTHNIDKLCEHNSGPSLYIAPVLSDLIHLRQVTRTRLNAPRCHEPVLSYSTSPTAATLTSLQPPPPSSIVGRYRLYPVSSLGLALCSPPNLTPFSDGSIMEPVHNRPWLGWRWMGGEHNEWSVL